MTRAEYEDCERIYMASGGLADCQQVQVGILAKAWHALSAHDQEDLAARPPAEGRPRFVTAGVVLRPTPAFEAMVSGAADDAIAGK